MLAKPKLLLSTAVGTGPGATFCTAKRRGYFIARQRLRSAGGARLWRTTLLKMRAILEEQLCSEECKEDPHVKKSEKDRL
jgi:hypothetical protein